MGVIDIVLMFVSILLGLTVAAATYAPSDAETKRRTAQDASDKPLSRTSAMVFFICVALIWAIVLMLKVAK